MLSQLFSLKTQLESSIHELQILCCLTISFRNHVEYMDKEVKEFGEMIESECVDYLQSRTAEISRKIQELYICSEKAIGKKSIESEDGSH